MWMPMDDMLWKCGCQWMMDDACAESHAGCRPRVEQQQESGGTQQEGHPPFGEWSPLPSSCYSTVHCMLSGHRFPFHWVVSSHHSPSSCYSTVHCMLSGHRFPFHWVVSGHHSPSSCYNTVHCVVSDHCSPSSCYSIVSGVNKCLRHWTLSGSCMPLFSVCLCLSLSLCLSLCLSQYFCLFLFRLIRPCVFFYLVNHI